MFLNLDKALQEVTNNAQQNELKIFPRYSAPEKVSRIPETDQASLITFYARLKNKFDIVRLPLQDELPPVEIVSTWDNIANSSTLDLASKGLDILQSGVTSVFDGKPVAKAASLAKNIAMFSLKAHNTQSFLSTYSRLYWNGSRWGRFTYDFTLLAIEDTVEDVIAPLKKLVTWAAPTTSRNMFKGSSVIAEGANYTGEAEKLIAKYTANDPTAYYLHSPPLISVKIGNLMELNQVAIIK